MGRKWLWKFCYTRLSCPGWETKFRLCAGPFSRAARNLPGPRSHFRFILWKRPLGSLCYWLFHFWRKEISPWVKWGEHRNTARRTPKQCLLNIGLSEGSECGSRTACRVVSPWGSYWGLLEAAGRGQRWPGAVGSCGLEASPNWGCRLYDLGHMASCISFWSAVKWRDVLGHSCAVGSINELFRWWWLFSRPVVSHSFRPHGLQHAGPLCPSASPEVCPSSCPLHQWCCL